MVKKPLGIEYWLDQAADYYEAGEDRQAKTAALVAIAHILFRFVEADPAVLNVYRR